MHKYALALRRMRFSRMPLQDPASDPCVPADGKGSEPILIIVCDAERMLGDESVSQPHHMEGLLRSCGLTRISAYHNGRMKAFRVCGRQ